MTNDINLGIASEAYLDYETLTLDVDGAVTITQILHTIAANTGTADNLDTITNGITNLSDGANDYLPFVILRADVGDIITVRHQENNIYIPGGGSVILTENNLAVFYDNDTNWVLANAVGQADAFTITNWTEDFALDCDAAAVAETNDVLATLIKVLIATGVLGGTVSA